MLGTTSATWSTLAAQPRPVPPAAAEHMTYSRRVTQLASEHPDRVAIVTVAADRTERRLTWGEYDTTSTRLGHVLAGPLARPPAQDVRMSAGFGHTSSHLGGRGRVVVIALGNTLEHFVCIAAAWKVGASVLSLSPSLPAPERDQLLALAEPAVVVASADVPGAVTPDELLAEASAASDDLLPDVSAQPARLVASGGSTGKSKIIVVPASMDATPGALAEHGDFSGMAYGQRQLVPGPMYHNMPSGWSHMGLFHDHTLVVLEKFDATLAADLIEAHRIEFMVGVPTHMARIVKLDDIDDRDLTSIEGFMHSAAPCPPWLKRRWIEVLGDPRKVYEGFGATEGVGALAIRGDEWLAHPGSVGRPLDCDLRILDEDGVELPPGEVGLIYTRPHAEGSTYDYIGTDRAPATEDGFITMGDMGSVDADGYLYLADRRTDLIITGGSNVYPAEVEAVLTQHPEVLDAAVIGLPDPDWGKKVHAVVETAPGSLLTGDDLLTLVRGALAPYKVPKSVELVDALPRNDAGKIRRSALVAERS